MKSHAPINWRLIKKELDSYKPVFKLKKLFDDNFNDFLDTNYEDDEDADFEEQVEKVVTQWNNKIEELGCKRTVRVFAEKSRVHQSGVMFPHPHDNELIVVPDELALKIHTLGYLP